MSGPIRLFHGTRAVLVKSGFILPPMITRARCARDLGYDQHDPSKVYAAATLEEAASYAITELREPAAEYNRHFVGPGFIYEAEPVGRLHPDPDYYDVWSNLSYCCDRLVIVDIHEVPAAIVKARHERELRERRP